MFCFQMSGSKCRQYPDMVLIRKFRLGCDVVVVTCARPVGNYQPKSGMVSRKKARYDRFPRLFSPVSRLTGLRHFRSSCLFIAAVGKPDEQGKPGARPIPAFLGLSLSTFPGSP